MVYFSPEPQFLRVSAILNEEKITPQRLGHKAVDDFSDGKSSCVADWQYHNKASQTEWLTIQLREDYCHIFIFSLIVFLSLFLQGSSSKRKKTTLSTRRRPVISPSNQNRTQVSKGICEFTIQLIPPA